MKFKIQGLTPSTWCIVLYAACDPPRPNARNAPLSLNEVTGKINGQWYCDKPYFTISINEEQSSAELKDFPLQVSGKLYSGSSRIKLDCYGSKSLPSVLIYPHDFQEVSTIEIKGVPGNISLYYTPDLEAPISCHLLKR